MQVKQTASFQNIAKRSWTRTFSLLANDTLYFCGKMVTQSLKSSFEVKQPVKSVTVFINVQINCCVMIHCTFWLHSHSKLKSSLLKSKQYRFKMSLFLKMNNKLCQIIHWILLVTLTRSKCEVIF